MSRIWATRRASSTASAEQQRFSRGRSPSVHSLIIRATTSKPCSTSSAAATALSTPPLSATIALVTSVLPGLVQRTHLAEPVDDPRQEPGHVIHVLLGSLL